MAFKVVSKSPNVEALELMADAGVTYTLGNLVVRDTTNSVLINATSSLADCTVLEAIVPKTQTVGAADAPIRVIPIHDGMYVIADCTNNTADNQLMKAHLLTDAGTVNNTSTHSADKDAVFVALKVVGAASDKKLFGRLVKTGQVVS